MKLVIKDKYNRLGESVSALCELVLNSINQCFFYELPTAIGGDTGNIIKPVKIDGTEAIDRAVGSYARFQYLKDQLPGTVFRMPGVIFVRNDLSSAVHDVNEQKDQLHDLILKEYKTRYKRVDICKELFKGCSMPQVYRNVRFLDGSVEAIGFTWMRKSHGARRMDLKGACKYIEGNIRDETDVGNVDRAKALKMTLDSMSAVGSDASFVLRRPVPLHPRANIKIMGKYKQVKANLPFIVHVNPDDVVCRDLKPLDMHGRDKQRIDTQGMHPLHEGIGLYMIKNESEA